jgi:tetratricopeptide (TPR) repeat protein
VQAIGRDLRVNLVIEGSVMRFKQLHVVVRIVDIHADRVVWKSNHDCDVEELLIACDRLTDAVAAEIRGLPSNGTVRSRAPSPAHLAYLKGRYHWNKRTESDLYRSVHEFQRALAIDPDFALAHAGLADAWVLLGILGLETSHSAFESARRAAERALHLDDRLAEAHTSLAEVLKDYDWDWTAAENGFRRAIALNPNYSTAHHYYSHLLVSQQRFEEAAAEIEFARQVDPLSPAIHAYVPYIYLAARNYARAVAEGKRAIELEPDSALAHWQFGRACLFSSDLHRALPELEIASKLAGRRSMWQATLCFARARAGDRCGAESVVNELTVLTQTAYVSPYDFALCYAGLGELELAIHHLEEAYRARVMRIISIGDPEWEILYAEPRFATLLRRLHLPQCR